MRHVLCNISNQPTNQPTNQKRTKTLYWLGVWLYQSVSIAWPFSKSDHAIVQNSCNSIRPPIKILKRSLHIIKSENRLCIIWNTHTSCYYDNNIEWNHTLHFSTMATTLKQWLDASLKSLWTSHTLAPLNTYSCSMEPLLKEHSLINNSLGQFQNMQSSSSEMTGDI